MHDRPEGLADDLAVAWLLADFFSLAVPWISFAIPLLVIAFLYVVPVTREPRLAREVLPFFLSFFFLSSFLFFFFYVCMIY